MPQKKKKTEIVWSNRGTLLHLCLMKDGKTYKILHDPKASDEVYIAYGPWYRNKCEWWRRVIKDHEKLGSELDMSRHISQIFVTNKPKNSLQNNKEKKEDVKNKTSEYNS